MHSNGVHGVFYEGSAAKVGGLSGREGRSNRMTPPAIASLRHSQVQMEQEDKMEDRVTYGDKYMGCRDTGNTLFGDTCVCRHTNTHAQRNTHTRKNIHMERHTHRCLEVS